jgi:hypothetical protein
MMMCVDDRDLGLDDGFVAASEQLPKVCRGRRLRMRHRHGRRGECDCKQLSAIHFERL